MLSYSKNDLKIAITLVETPMMRANTPNMTIAIFLLSINFRAAPFVSFAYTSVSINAGNAIPSDDRQSAPNREMNKSNFGIATAKITNRTKTDLFEKKIHHH